MKPLINNPAESLWEKFRNHIYSVNGPLQPPEMERHCSHCFYAGIGAAGEAVVAYFGKDSPETRELGRVFNMLRSEARRAATRARMPVATGLS